MTTVPIDSRDRDIVRTYPVVSADTHINVPEHFWDRLPKELRHLAPKIEERNGHRYLLVDGGAPHRAVAGVEELRALGVDDITMQKQHRADPTGGLDHDVRAREEARDGVDAEVLYPNLAFTMYASPDGAFQRAAAIAHNDFLAEWTFGRRHRYAPAAMVPMAGDFDATIAEMTRARDLGFKSVAIPPAIPWLPYVRDEYDRVWSAFEDLELILAFHVFTGNNLLGSDFADVRRMDRQLFEQGLRSAANEDFSEGLHRTVMGMAAGMSPVVNLTSGGVLERHPRLRFVIVEAELGWLGWVLQAMDVMQRRRGHCMGYQLPERASDYFRRQGWITFTDDVYGMMQAEVIGIDRILWSNDFPHDEGTFLESSATIPANLGHLSSADQRRILWQNAADLYGFEAEPLIADRTLRG